MPRTRKPALDEAFHRSKITSLTISTVLFVVSIVGPKAFSKASVFNVQFDGINQKFAIACLILAAVVSSASLFLAYINNALSYQRATISNLEFDSVPTEIIRSLSDYKERIIKLEEYARNSLETSTVRDADRSAIVALSADAVCGALRQIWTVSDSREIANLVHANVRRVLAELHGTPEASGSSFANIDVQVEKIIERRAEDFWSSKDAVVIYGREIDNLKRVSQHISSNLLEMKAAIDKVLKNIALRNRAISGLKSTIVWQITVIDFAIPMLVSAVALAHGLGALGIRAFDSLPVTLGYA